MEKSINPHSGPSLLSFAILFLIVGILVSACGASRPGQAAVGVPRGPEADTSSEAFEQGLRFIRENPSEREDERVQHFLWLDQWIQVFERNGRLSQEQGTRYAQDLTSFVAEPPLGRTSLERIGSRTTTVLGKNIVSYHLYLNALRESTIDSALNYLRMIQDEPYSGLYAQAQSLLQYGVSTGQASPGKVGVLVPLTGELKSFGKEIVDSLQSLSSFAASEGMEFVFADSGSNNDDLERALQKLVNEENVVAIIGPVTSSASQFVFERAELLQVPVISLAPRENLGLVGQYSFRSALTLQDQITAMAGFIRDRLSARRVAVLYPESDYGWDAAKLAQRIFKDAGLEIKHMALYPAGATDFKEQLKIMTRLDNPRARQDEVCPKNAAFEGCVKSVNDLAPILDFEVLFVPDFADTVGLLLPTLPFLRIYGVQVVGLSGFHSQKLLERGQDAAEGTVFTDSFFPESGDFRSQLFVSRFKEIAGTNPSKMAAEALDMGAVLLSIFQRNRSGLNRELVKSQLSSIYGFPGVTGDLYVDNRQFRKRPRFLIVRNGKFNEFR